jgi:hypothetical protein
MVRLPSLVSALAAVDYRDRPSIDFIARKLREADLVVRDKRGVGAASQGAAEAANLLLGICADQPKNAVDTVNRFRSLKVVKETGATKVDLRAAFVGVFPALPEPPEGFLAAITRIAKAKQLNDALEACLTGAPTVAGWMSLAEEQLRDVGFEITLRRPSFTASIELWCLHDGKRRPIWGQDYRPDRMLRSQGFYGPAIGQGFRQTSETIGWQQLHALHVAMAEEAVPAS